MPDDAANLLRLDRALCGAEEFSAAASALLSLEVADAAKAEFLKTMRQRGETADEIAGFAEAFLQFAIDPMLTIGLGLPVLDVCGTGGDGLHLFNISTASMFVLAAGGVTVVKHGNRAITSKSGGADVLEALGIKIDVEPLILQACVDEAGCGFIFAQKYHPAFKAVAPVRKQLAAEGVPTIFNLLGPLLNPARPTHQLVGVFNPEILEKYAQVLLKMGRECAWVVHGKTPDGRGMDELSTLGPTLVAGVDHGETASFELTWSDARRRTLEELQGGDAAQNAAIMEGILRDGPEHSAIREIVALNAAAGLFITDAVDTLEEGSEMAFEIMADGSAWEIVEVLRAVSHS